MNWQQASFLGSATSEKGYPKLGLPEVALVGRSNVGKSSLINALLNRKNLARTSSNPGRTQTLNFYLVADAFIFVDLPGYGFAKVPMRVREQWGPMIERYLREREELCGIIQIVDSRHDPTRDDLQMMDWLKAMELPWLLVGTKVDKVPRSKQKAHLDKLKAINADLIAFSATTGLGKRELTGAVTRLIESPRNRV